MAKRIREVVRRVFFKEESPDCETFGRDPRERLVNLNETHIKVLEAERKFTRKLKDIVIKTEGCGICHRYWKNLAKEYEEIQALRNGHHSEETDAGKELTTVRPRYQVPAPHIT